VVPDAIRGRIATFGPVRFAKSLIRPSAVDLHNHVYDAAYYSNLDATTGRSAPIMAVSIVRDLAPGTVFDVGCGTGALLLELSRHGVAGEGVEYSNAGIAYCRARSLRVHQFDLESGTVPPPAIPFDLVLSTEVAEHLPEHLADRFVQSLVTQGRTIVLTAATPGQGGTDHVNEQPHEYWIEKFAARGFVLDSDLTQRWRREWGEARIAFWFANNVMVFRG
jgi:SAM-dependent methyltransferase